MKQKEGNLKLRVLQPNKRVNMTKIVLDTVSSGYNLGKINANFEKIEDQLNDKVLYRDNTSTPTEPNELEQDLDMNSNRILNLPVPTSPTEPLRHGDITSDETGATVQYVDDSVAVVQADVDNIPTDIINDLSQAYTFKTVALMKASLIVFPVGKKIFWQGYYAASDGGSNWGIVTSGAHTDDGGSVFTLADGQYIAANIKGKINVRKFGARGTYVPDVTLGVLGVGTDDAPEIQNAIAYAKTLKTGATLKLASVYVPRGVYLLSSGLEITGLEFGGDDLSTEFYMNPDVEFIGISSAGECYYKNFYIDGGWNGNRANPIGFPTILHKKLSGATVVWSGQFRVDNVWGQHSKGDFVQAFAFGYTDIKKLTGRGLRQNGLVMIGEQIGNSSITSTTLSNVNMASCEYAIRLNDTFAVQVNAVWEACRGILVAGTSNRNLSFIGCYSEAIEAGFMPINFEAGTTGLGFSVSGCFLNEGFNGDVQSFENTGFRRVFISGNTGEVGIRYEDDSPFKFNRVTSNGSIIDIERDNILQATVRSEGGVTTLQQEVDSGVLKLLNRDAASAVYGLEVTIDGGTKVVRPTADRAIQVGVAARRIDTGYIAVDWIVGSDVRIKKSILRIPQPLLDFALTVEMFQYKLRANDSERNHYGIIITEEFIASLNEVYDVNGCAALCHSVFTDEDGSPIELEVGGVMLGDLWQVRYDEWQNILLEAMRRKINSL